jgi:hypothetical protein
VLNNNDSDNLTIHFIAGSLPWHERAHFLRLGDVFGWKSQIIDWTGVKEEGQQHEQDVKEMEINSVTFEKYTCNSLVQTCTPNF